MAAAGRGARRSCGRAVDENELASYLMYPKVFAEFAGARAQIRPGLGAADADLLLRHEAGRGDHDRDRARQGAGHPAADASARPTRRARSASSSSSTASRASSGCRTAPPRRRVQARRKAEEGNDGACRRADAGRGLDGRGQGRPAGQGRRRAADHRGDEDGDGAARRRATAPSARCWSRRARRSTRRTCSSSWPSTGRWLAPQPYGRLPPTHRNQGESMTRHPAFAAGRAAVITGAASGIGLAAARRFAELGMHCALPTSTKSRWSGRRRRCARPQPPARPASSPLRLTSRPDGVERLRSRRYRALRRGRGADEQCRHRAGGGAVGDRSAGGGCWTSISGASSTACRPSRRR